MKQITSRPEPNSVFLFQQPRSPRFAPSGREKLVGRRHRPSGSPMVPTSGAIDSASAAPQPVRIEPVSEYQRLSRTLAKDLIDRGMVEWSAASIRHALGAMFHSSTLDALAAWVYAFLTSGRLDPDRDAVDQLEAALLGL
jgi:hypothetical protein